MPATVTHIKSWIERSEADYYTMFIKTWIPFNAWYMSNYYDEDTGITTDSRIIAEVMSNSNSYRDRIIALLKGNNEEAIKLKIMVARLHIALESHPIPNIEEHISFTQVCISDNPNANTPIQETVGRFTCKVRHDTSLPRTSNRWILEVIKTRNGATEHLIQLKRCSQHELSENTDFKNIADGKIRGRLQKCLNMISPSMTTDITKMPRIKDGKQIPPANCTVIDSNDHVYFCNNYDSIAKAIIRILYELRCKLFHGEVEPTLSNMEIYEYAYHIQRMFIKNLI